MATHSSVLAWRIPGTGEPGGLLSMGSHREAWCAAIHGVTKSPTQLSNFTFIFHFNALEKEMAAHSSILAWRIPGTGKPGGLPSMGSHRVGHDCRDLAERSIASAVVHSSSELCSLKINGKTKCGWRRQWHPTPVLLPGKSHGWRSLEGCSPWGR